MNLIEKMFGTHSERELKLIYPIVDKIVALKPEMEKLTDDELKDNTRKFRERLEKGETLDDILPVSYTHLLMKTMRKILKMRLRNWPLFRILYRNRIRRFLSIQLSWRNRLCRKGKSLR